MKSRKTIMQEQSKILRNCHLLYNQVNEQGKEALSEINQTAKDTIKMLEYQEAEKRCDKCKYARLCSSVGRDHKVYRCYRPLQSKHANPTYAAEVDADWYCKDWKTLWIG